MVSQSSITNIARLSRRGFGRYRRWLKQALPDSSLENLADEAEGLPDKRAERWFREDKLDARLRNAADKVLELGAFLILFATPGNLLGLVVPQGELQGIAVIKCVGPYVESPLGTGLGWAYMLFIPDLSCVLELPRMQGNGIFRPDKAKFTFSEPVSHNPVTVLSLAVLTGLAGMAASIVAATPESKTTDAIAGIGPTLTILCLPHWPSMVKWSCEGFGALAAAGSGLAVARKWSRVGRLYRDLEIAVLLLIPELVPKYGAAWQGGILSIFVSPLFTLTYIRSRIGYRVFWDFLVGDPPERHNLHEVFCDKCNPLPRRSFTMDDVREGSDDVAARGLDLCDLLMLRIGLSQGGNCCSTTKLRTIISILAIFLEMFLGLIAIYYHYYTTMIYFLLRGDQSLISKELGTHFGLTERMAVLFIAFTNMTGTVGLVTASVFGSLFRGDGRWWPLVIAAGVLLLGALKSRMVWSWKFFRHLPRFCGPRITWSDGEPKKRRTYTYVEFSKTLPMYETTPCERPRTRGYDYYDGDLIQVAEGIYHPACGRIWAGIPQGLCVLDPTNQNKVISFGHGSTPLHPVGGGGLLPLPLSGEGSRELEKASTNETAMTP